MLSFTIEVDIDKTCNQVVGLMRPENTKQWMPGFIKMEHISGGLWVKGSKYVWHFKLAGRVYQYTETLIVRNLPEIYSGTLEGPDYFAEFETVLQSLPNGETRWVSKYKFEGTKMLSRVLMKILPSSYKSQVKRNMIKFKEFAEKQ